MGEVLSEGEIYDLMEEIPGQKLERKYACAKTLDCHGTLAILIINVKISAEGMEDEFPKPETRSQTAREQRLPN